MSLSAQVKTELTSPPSKRQCLNQCLMQPKVEATSPPKPPVETTASDFPGSAGTALAGAASPASSPAGAAHRPAPAAWQTRLRNFPSKLVISLSSPPPPTGTKRSITTLSPACAFRHARSPPPPPGAGCSIRDPAETAEEPTPRGDTGGTPSRQVRGSRTSDTKKVHNAFNQQKNTWRKKNPSCYSIWMT